MQQPADSPTWRNLLAAKNIPTTLPHPIPAPKPPNSDPNAPPTMTTDPVQYLAAAYFAYIHGFETHMQKTRQASYARQQAMAIAQGRPPPPPPVMPSLAGVRLPGQAPSPADSWSPASAQAQTPAQATPSLPPPTPIIPTSAHPAPSPSDSVTSATKPLSSSGPPRARKTSSKKEKKDLAVNTNVPSPVDGEAETPTGSSGGKKRKRKNANASQPVCSQCMLRCKQFLTFFSFSFFNRRKPALHPLRPQQFLRQPPNLLRNPSNEHVTASNIVPSTFPYKHLPAGNLPWSPLLFLNIPLDKVHALSMISQWSIWRR